jgi:ferredoxin-type protein NapH
VCPVNLVTDAAAWLRRRLGLKGGKAPARQHALLAARFRAGDRDRDRFAGVGVGEPGVDVPSWPDLRFGLAWGIVGGIFLYDLLIAPRGWCGHLCPQGAFYALLGRASVVKVSADKRSACNDCMDCFAVCPEPQVIRPALKAVGQDHPLILDADCTTCGRCVDVCGKDVFRITTRFNRSES